VNTAHLERAEWHPEAIAGRHVILRRHRPDHLAAVTRWYRDPEIARLTRFHVGPVSDDEIRAFFSNRLLSPGAFAYAIHVAASDHLIGTTTFSALDPDNQSVMFHISIGERDAWGRGYGTEATEMMIAHAFERIGLHRVALSVFAFNERAIRSYLKVGFTIEGRAREAVWRDGRFWDEVHMGILSREWRARRDGRGPGGTAQPPVP
jgi:RimJ/RimL family protein N-acetyltransferase